MKIDLAICAIVKNEAPYIKEWIEYHKMIGVQKFYIYDNESTDNLLSVLAPYIYRGLVEYTQIEGYAKQLVAYNECLEKCRENVKWLAYIDLDEFIVPVKGYSLAKVLKEYEEFPGIGINWVMYDSDEHIEKPKGGVIENYTRCRYNYAHGENHHIKSIVKPSQVIKMQSPHHALYENDLFECLLTGNPRAPGHRIISTKEHYKDMMDLPDDLCREIYSFARRTMVALKEVYGAESVYLCTMCDGPMNHFHVQLIPRYGYEQRGSSNFVKERLCYVDDREKLFKMRKKLNSDL